MKSLIKTILIIIPIIFFTQKSFSQYGNEWINYDLEYFKFKIGKDGVYRISSTTLSSLGLASVPGSQFTIYRNGIKVPIYVSSNSTFGSGDYIEFYGMKNDGKLETALYSTPSWHPTDEYSLITDTAYYFLTYTSGTHPRYTTSTFTIPAPAPAPETYFWYTLISNNGMRPNTFMPGRSYNTEFVTNKATFDIGEGFALNISTTGTPRTSTNTLTIKALHSSAAINAKLSFAFTNFQNGAGSTKFYVGTNLIDEVVLPSYTTLKKEYLVASNKFTASTNIIARDNTRRGGFNIIKVEYPRLTNFSTIETSFVKFQNNENPSGLYYVMTNVPNLGTQPVLYNLTTNNRYIGVTSGTTCEFYLPGSGSRQDFVFSGEMEIEQVTALEPIEFVDYTNAANQGEYIILTHRGYIQHPSDPIGKYKSYRESAAGGSRNVAVIDVMDLYDQFNYGAEFNPIAVKNFLKYAEANWTTKPKTVFIIGKGLLFTGYKTYLSNPSAHAFSFPVPTWGHPGSDVSLVDINNDDHPDYEVGRLSAWSATEILNYLDKVKRYESAISSTEVPNLENSLWKKSALHIAGGDLTLQSTYLVPTLAECENIFADSFYGGRTTTIKKSTSDVVPELTHNELISKTLNEGVSRMTFYGHAYSTGFDYNLNEPDLFNVSPKFPIFYAMGCDIAQIFGFNKTIGENYLNSTNGGSVAIIASNNYGYVGHLNNYIMGTYRQFSYLNFGSTVGRQFQQNISSIPGSADLLKVHKQCIILQGDPGLINYNPQQIDFYTDNDLITPSKNPLSTADSAVHVKVKFYNLGRVTNDSAIVVLEHKKPDGTIVNHPDTLKINVDLLDSVTFIVPLDPLTDIGQNIITVRINPDNAVEEISTLNNTAVLSIFVREDVLRPIYPYEFSIVHKLPLELKASALNTFETGQDYILQIDTTEKFNSPIKQEKIITNSIGGVVSWKPTIPMKDSTVYYWRTAVASTITDSTNWLYSSFIYLVNGSDGWNQSHFYQFEKNKPYTNLTISESNRKFNFSNGEVVMEVRNRVLSPTYDIPGDARTLIDNDEVDRAGCNFTGTIKFILIDTLTLKPVAYNAEHLSIAPCAAGSTTRNHHQFEFQLNTATWRKRAADFIENIPEGYYVVVTNFATDYGTWSPITYNTAEWLGDDALYGEENTLRYKLKQLGFETIDSLNRKRAFIYVTKTGDPSFENVTMFSEDISELLMLQLPIKSWHPQGNMQSVVIGPGKNWKTFKWNVNHPHGVPATDTINFILEAENPTTGAWDVVYTGNDNDLNLAPIVPAASRHIRLKWISKDSENRTSANLNFWRVLYDPLPEAALNPIAHFQVTGDTILQGQPFNFSTIIENISHLNMDSMLVKFSVNKADGTNEVLGTKRFGKLPAEDTIVASFTFNPKNLLGMNTFIIEANPFNDQPEQFHPNNLGYFDFFVKKDDINPVIDVTFDGVHILDRDIVSAKPMIKIMLRDENNYALMSDTSLVTVKLLRPGKTVAEEVIIDGVTATLIPASSASKNEMTIEYNPELLEDGEYKLIVTGKDVADNLAGSTRDEFEVSFMVENKPSVTNVLNYPNPFSTSTSFIFTLTGSEVPDQFKIQIMTVTGKIVREITKEELGTIRIGRNITDYKWDGRDQYGQLLGNGVYIYRLVVNHKGFKIEHRDNQNVDKYFHKKGYGKLYIMR